MNATQQALALSVVGFMLLMLARGAVPARAQPSFADVAYLPADRAEKLDVYLPPTARDGGVFPAIVFIHGGGWAGGDKNDARSRNLAKVLTEAGYVFVSVNYKLAEKPVSSYHEALGKSFPQNLMDCKAAVRFVRDQAAKYQVDPDRIGLMGASAGAHLAALAAYTDAKDEFGDRGGPIRCLVGLYGIYDWADFQKKNIRTEADRELARKASPLTYLDKSDPPTFAIHGTKDIHVPHRQTLLLAQNLKELGISHQAIIVEGAPHSFDFNLKQRDLKADLLPFLEKNLKGR